MVGGKISGLLILLICCIERSHAQNDSVFNSKSLSSFNLYNAGTAANIHLPNSNTDKKFTLFIFLSPECPLSQGYLPLLNSLKKSYSEAFAFYGIIPGMAYSPNEVSEFATTYHIQFPLLIDSSQALTHYLKAKVTPEAILLNQNNDLIYRGAVDDLLVGLGKRKLKAEHEYLKNAIVECLQEKPVSVKRTRAVGCKINDY